MRRLELLSLLPNCAAAIDWARDNELLTKNAKCPTCAQDMKLKKHNSTDMQIWNCSKTMNGVRHYNKTSIREGSIFAGSRIAIREAIMLIYEWSRGTSVVDCMHEYKLSKDCVIPWFSKLRTIASKKVKESSRKELLGNNTDVVEIDEAQIGRRKSHKGRKRNEVWVFGAVVRGTHHQKSFMKIVKNRKKETLQKIIEKNINKQVRLVVSDGWASYDNLNAAGFNHKSVNHSINFVSPNDKEVHTQTIEGYWKHLRSFLNKNCSYKRKHLANFLNEFIFRRNASDCFECILSAIQRKFSV
jgi:IS1 family transposase